MPNQNSPWLAVLEPSGSCIMTNAQRIRPSYSDIHRHGIQYGLDLCGTWSELTIGMSLGYIV
jgi:hypothetical protein